MSASAIGARRVGSGEPVYVIAEAGVNHNGKLDLAYELIDVAAAAGADAVKFQTFRAEALASGSARKAAYQQTRSSGTSQLEMLRPLELSPAAHRKLQVRCEQAGIEFMSSPFDRESVDLLDELGVAAFKLGSGEVTNWPLLRYVAAKGRPVLLSTGMSDLAEVLEAVGVLQDAGAADVALFHCVSQYPAPPEDANLSVIPLLAAATGLPIGWSDHTTGTDIALAAVALGSRMIEKHFTLDRTLEGPDHEASLEPAELAAMIAGIRRIEAAIGQPVKRPAPSELDNRLLVRRSLAAAVAVEAGGVLTEEVLTELRPADGIPCRFRDVVIGRRVRRTISASETIKWDDLQ